MQAEPGFLLERSLEGLLMDSLTIKVLFPTSAKDLLLLLMMPDAAGKRSVAAPLLRVAPVSSWPFSAMPCPATS